MEAKIVTINKNYIQVETEIGTFFGTWCGGEPLKDRTYYLELDFPEIITKQQVRLACESQFSIRQDSEKTELIGRIETIEDTILVFRLGTSLTMIEIECPEDFNDYIGKFVCISLQKVNLYDIGIQS